MTIQPISAAALALYLSPADLEARGLRCSDITPEHTLALTREALALADMPMSVPLEIEFWPDRCGLLVFIQLDPPSHTVWSFAHADDLFAAARALHTRLPGNTLYWWKDRFWLILDSPSIALSEFCDQADEDPYLPVRIQEYGTRLLASDALTQLHRRF